MSSSRPNHHTLSNGLIVSGPPEIRPVKRQLSENSRAMPYTGGDVKNSGELAKMFGIDVTLAPPARPGPKTGSGPLGKKTSSSSGPILHPTGLITSGPITSGPLGSNRRSSGQVDGHATMGNYRKVNYGPDVTNIGSRGVRMEYGFSRLGMWAFLVLAMMGLIIGTFLYTSVNKPALLIVVVAILVPAIILVVWNVTARNWGIRRFLIGHRNSVLGDAKNGDLVKVTGIVTCGLIPLETSFEKVPRCVYTSTELHEYKGNHGLFSWRCRYSENYVADFYISDFQSGLRVLVKAGHGAKVAPFVKSTTIVDSTKGDKDTSSNFMCWLSERGLTTNDDDRLMRLKEGYIREGSTASVTGVIHREGNVLMIIPPEEHVSTGYSWSHCLLPTYIEGLVINYVETKKAVAAGDAIPV